MMESGLGGRKRRPDGGSSGSNGQGWLADGSQAGTGVRKTRLGTLMEKEPELPPFSR